MIYERSNTICTIQEQYGDHRNEASLLLEVTAGCTHHKCKFCTLYDDIPFQFKMSPMEDIEADLQEVKGQFRLWNDNKVIRTFLVGANPFCIESNTFITNCFSYKKIFSNE